MAKIKFRTADGRTVTFASGAKRNPSWSPRYRGRKGSISAMVDAQDRSRSKGKRGAKKTTTKQAKKVGGKYNVHRSSSTIKVTRPGVSASHRYANVAVAKAAYSRLTSMKAAESFIERYGKGNAPAKRKSTKRKTKRSVAHLKKYQFKKGQGGRKTSKRGNTGRCSPSRNTCIIPKGKRKGDVFTKQGKRWRVISYTLKNGTRVR